MNLYYILQGHEAVPAQDAIEWGTWFEKAIRAGATIVKQEDIEEGVRVSTVFIGLDHGHAWLSDTVFPYQPLIFETMVFGGPLDAEQERYSTWAGAEDGHKRIVTKVREAMSEKKYL